LITNILTLRCPVDDFPLPPSTDAPFKPVNPMIQVQTAQHPQAQDSRDSLPSYDGSDNISPLDNPYSPPVAESSQPTQPLRVDSKQQAYPPLQAVPANFRALPLLSSDLPRTAITVSHSFVRPNDRGKEVLSFVVSVNPGNKEGWRVEKMYSDVLGLDQRVRNTVGKSAARKIASLPEGRLWKDHAPAKVDQRKVRV
jgi:RalA-binding protein 1